MWSGASHGLRRTLAYLGGRLVRQNAIRTPPKCPPTYLRSRVGRGSWEKWAFHDEAMTMFEEGLSQLVGSHSGEGNWCRALVAHRMQLSSRVWVYAAAGARPGSFISTFYPEPPLRGFSALRSIHSENCHQFHNWPSIGPFLSEAIIEEVIAARDWRGPRDSLAPRLFVP